MCIRDRYQSSLKTKVDKIQRAIIKDGHVFEWITPHTFRHTFATRCFEAGIDAKVVQKFLGHYSISITLDLYTHITNEKAKEESPADINTGIYHYGMYSACYFCTDIAGEIKDKYIREYEQSGRG